MQKIILFILCLAPVLLRAQVSGTLYFRGKVNDVHEIAITLSIKADSCSGAVVYLRSGFQLELRGLLKEGQLSLNEIDDAGLVCGIFEGNLISKLNNDDWSIEGQWFNANRTSGQDWRLEETPQLETKAQFCSDTRTVRRYVGTHMGYLVECIMNQSEEGRVSGNLYLGTQSRVYTVSGSMTDKGKSFKLAIIDEKADAIGSLEGTWINDNTLNVFLETSNIPSGNLVMYLNETVDKNCMEYIDYTALYRISFPEYGANKAFNDWMVNAVNEEIKQFRTLKQTVVNKPENRQANRLYSWWEVEFISPEFVSGWITFGWTDTSKTKTLGFLYDIKQGKMCQMNDIFKEASLTTLQEEVKTTSLKEISKLPWYHVDGFDQWLTLNMPNIVCLRKDGILFMSNYHPIAGNQMVLFPFDRLKMFANPETPIGKFILSR
jgi:hypothetical protein